MKIKQNQIYFLNFLASMRHSCNFKWVIVKLISRIDNFIVSCEIAFRWMPQDLTDDWFVIAGSG